MQPTVKYLPCKNCPPWLLFGITSEGSSFLQKCVAFVWFIVSEKP